MPPNLITWFETIFNVIYLIVIWLIVFVMIKNKEAVLPENRSVADLIRLAFVVLAAGDTGHVGFRVLTTLLGESNSEVMFFGAPMSWLGLGMLITAYTVTLFYMIFVLVWKARYKKSDTWFTNLLLAIGVVRLIFMALPGNQWGNMVPARPMNLYRNLPLLLQGVGIVILIFRDAYKANDNLFKWFAWLITASFGFYLPVILFANKIPMLGMLMIPKTVAYVIIAWVAYRRLWTQPKPAKRRQ